MGLTIINAAESSEYLSTMEDSLQDIFFEASNHLGDCDANVKFITRKEMQSLNHQFRGKDACTNVLAFPNETFAEDQFLEMLLFVWSTVIKKPKSKINPFNTISCICYTCPASFNRL